MTDLQGMLGWLETLDFSKWSSAEIERDEWLELRDSPPFDVEWTRAFALVGERKCDAPIGSDELEIIGQMRETAFAKTVEATGHTELAAYVSDDFDLLGRFTRRASR
ncbi:hypothetical protein IAD21_04011 [Abditibacteriota bacterium]|nr:hypothetical protein IAD21_04011 [Abditibacteriota bacterium]